MTPTPILQTGENSNKYINLSQQFVFVLKKHTIESYKFKKNKGYGNNTYYCKQCYDGVAVKGTYLLYKLCSIKKFTAAIEDMFALFTLIKRKVRKKLSVQQSSRSGFN